MLCLVDDDRFAGHDPGPGHPERPARREAVVAGVAAAHLGSDLVTRDARDATRTELEAVHAPAMLDALEQLSRDGGGRLDPDTAASAGSWTAAVRAAGAGLAAVEALDAGVADAAFCAVRPPGHHATPTRAMGFCLLNNVAVTAAALRDRGERVLIVDWDAHHGNGTQDAFWRDPAVLYVSLHEWPLYPGTGALHEIGAGAGVGHTCNFPLPPGATGDVYLDALDRVVAPLVERFDPTWVLVSAGYDAHRADPLTGLALSAGDFAGIARRVAAFAPALGRLVAFLEGGYDLEAMRDSVTATVHALAGVETASDAPTSGGAGGRVVDVAADLWIERAGIAGL